MSHTYRIMLEHEELTIGPVSTTERTDREYTFLDAQGNIVAMFRREMVHGIVRAMPEASDPKPEPEPEPPPAPPEPERKPAPAPTPQAKPQLPPANKKAPVETGVMPTLPRPIIQMRKNRDTQGFEVSVLSDPVAPQSQKLVEQPHMSITESLELARMEVAATLLPPQADLKPGTQERIVEMKYKDIVATGILDPVTKKVTVEKGTLIAKKETNSLRKAKNQSGVRAKRRAVLRRHTLPYNHEYSKLATDVEFSSLSQACCVISGTILNPKQYWKEVQ